MRTSTVFRSASLAVALLGLAGALQAQSPSAEAWKLVPALPTTCFSGDGLSEQLRAADQKLGAEVERQEQANTAARERFQNMDMAEKMQRMQAFMMKNPQAAAKMMSGMQELGASTHAELPEVSAATERLDAELKALEERFSAAVEQAKAPVRAKQEQLIATKTVEVGEVGAGMFTAPADREQHVQLVAEENAAIERACASFFGAGGSFHQWLDRYRTEVMDRLIASEVARDAALAEQMQAMGLPGEDFRSTAPLERARQFVGRVEAVYGLRPARTEPWIQLR